MKGCIFCEILGGRLPASFVYEDAYTAAFMSLEQPNPYKVLVVPHEHIKTLYDLSDDLAAKLFQTTVRVARAVRDASSCEGLNMIQSNGRAGGQDAFHVHVHLVPRYEDDNIVLNWDDTPTTQAERDALAATLRLFIS